MTGVMVSRLDDVAPQEGSISVCAWTVGRSQSESICLANDKAVRDLAEALSRGQIEMRIPRRKRRERRHHEGSGPMRVLRVREPVMHRGEASKPTASRRPVIWRARSAGGRGARGPPTIRGDERPRWETWRALLADLGRSSGLTVCPYKAKGCQVGRGLRCRLARAGKWRAKGEVPIRALAAAHLPCIFWNEGPCYKMPSTVRTAAATAIRCQLKAGESDGSVEGMSLGGANAGRRELGPYIKMQGAWPVDATLPRKTEMKWASRSEPIFRRRNLAGRQDQTGKERSLPWSRSRFDWKASPLYPVPNGDDIDVIFPTPFARRVAPNGPTRLIGSVAR
ncbi:hypothetical protein CMUS01_15885 [Colletotrichum musicola]|uniref:Uncharacterized protein n=1 Tax=Colletotrichum musicola TaxID=2175873 RepID=A0A8H6MLB5_9PEZI|nr:hypothetical protein CMUS01_15885 [Colletotrichum musicola]